MGKVLLFSRGSQPKDQGRKIQKVQEKKDDRGTKLAERLLDQINKLHVTDYYEDVEIEKMLLRQRTKEVSNITKPHIPPQYKDLVYFSPSGASKCNRELWFKSAKAQKDEVKFNAYHRRWTRNASAVHEAIQRDLLYCEKNVEDHSFKVARTEEGLPKWEQNIKTYKVIEHNGETFGLYGMSDGILQEVATGKEIGFEFKTKSTSIGAVGNYKMKDAQDSHKTQCTAYAILFGVYEHLIVYESLAKDKWTANDDAKPDVRVFYHKVTDQDVTDLLDKYAEITKNIRLGKIPKPETDKCLFCNYKDICFAVAESDLRLEGKVV